jgi:hypothetical protein
MINMGQMTLDWDGSLEEGEQSLEPEDLGYRLLTSKQYKPYQKILREWSDLGLASDLSFVIQISPSLGEKVYYKIEEDVFYVIRHRKKQGDYRAVNIPLGSTREIHIRTLLNDLRQLNDIKTLKTIETKISMESVRQIPEILGEGHFYHVVRAEKHDEYINRSDRISLTNIGGSINRKIREKVNRFKRDHPKHDVVSLEPIYVNLLDEVFTKWHKGRFHAHMGRTALTREKAIMKYILELSIGEGMYVVLIDDIPVGVSGVIHLKDDYAYCPIEKHVPSYNGLSDFMAVVTIQKAYESGYEWVSDGSWCGVQGLKDFKEKYFNHIYKMYSITYNKKHLGDSKWDK